MRGSFIENAHEFYFWDFGNSAPEKFSALLSSEVWSNLFSIERQIISSSELLFPTFSSSNPPKKPTLTFSVLLVSWGSSASSGFLELLDVVLDDEEAWLDCESAC